MWGKLIKNHNFLSSPIRLAIISTAILIICALFLGLNKISYAYPWPVLATLGLAAVVPLISWAIKDIDRRLNDLQTQNRALVQERDALQTQIDGKNVTINQPQWPTIKNLKILVERWQSFNPEDEHREILDEQFSIMLSIAQLEYSYLDEIFIDKYFPGTKIKGGAFLLRLGSNGRPLVVKIDSETNIEQEIKSYKDYIQQYLANTYGPPLRPKQRLGKIDNKLWGATTYNLLLQGTGNQPKDLRQLQTFADYYDKLDITQFDNEALGKVFSKIFQAIEPLWEVEREWPDAFRQTRRSSLYDEYDRLSRKSEGFKKGIQEVGTKLHLDPLKTIGPDATFISLTKHLALPLRNPLNWVEDIFKKRQLGPWLQTRRRDSIVHGDFHAGNLLVIADPQGDIIQPWVIDFPHSHVGPTIQDLARLEADIKFRVSNDTLENLSIAGIYELELALLPKPADLVPPLVSLNPNELPTHQNTISQLQKTRAAVKLLRTEARGNNYMGGDDARPYYLALLHATLPVLYYRDRSPWQKLYAFLSATILCERLHF